RWLKAQGSRRPPTRSPAKGGVPSSPTLCTIFRSFSGRPQSGGMACRHAACPFFGALPASADEQGRCRRCGQALPGADAAAATAAGPPLPPGLSAPGAGAAPAAIPSMTASDIMSTEASGTGATQGMAALQVEATTGSEMYQLDAIEVDDEDIRRTVAAAAAAAVPAAASPIPAAWLQEGLYLTKLTSESSAAARCNLLRKLRARACMEDGPFSPPSAPLVRRVSDPRLPSRQVSPASDRQVSPASDQQVEMRTNVPL
ncbi:unnamed protein product, partial [Prorocentrum cordatum]